MPLFALLLLLQAADGPTEVPPVRTVVTVTARVGSKEDQAGSERLVASKDREAMTSRPTPVIAAALDSAPGVLVQQSSYAQASPFLRGLTGYQVLNLIDGVRYNNSTFRSGPNQYLAFLEPSQFERIEAALGQAGATYGSDAMGGAIQVLTPEPRFQDAKGLRLTGWGGVFGATGDRGGGADAHVAVSSERFYWHLGGSGRRHNDLRAGNASDSRNVFRRLFNLDAKSIRAIAGTRLQDTAFTQYGFDTKLAYRDATQGWTGWYQFGEQAGVNAYKDLMGGLGNLQSAFEPQRLQFGYLRYQRQRTGWFDLLSATVSINSQADGSLRQGLRSENPVTLESNRLDALGYSAQAAKAWGPAYSLLLGGEVYDERAHASRTQNGRMVRPLYPRGSRYITSAGYAEQQSAWMGGRLRGRVGARLTSVGFSTSEDAAFGVPASNQRFSDVTMHSSLAWQFHPAAQAHVLVGRGFRAPNLNDLGAIGLNDLGYEIPASEAANALIGLSAGEAAASTGRLAKGLRPEALWNYEAGVSLRGKRTLARVQLFDAELYSPIQRRTLLFPAGAVPATLAGQIVTSLPPSAAQQAQSVVAVRTAADPRTVKAFVNEGRGRYYGVESLLETQFARRWTFYSGLAYIVGRDLNPNRPARRLPPLGGHSELRYLPSRRGLWISAGMNWSGAQTRLSGGDLDDERIGAARSRRDIADFFLGGRVAPLLTTDGRFIPTGETLPQIQDRVLPGAGDTTRIPLYQSTAGWASFYLRAGIPLAESLILQTALENLLDKNHRVHGSGVDAPGISAFVSLRWNFQ